jgi:excisionase family DNA binding protein
MPPPKPSKPATAKPTPAAITPETPTSALPLEMTTAEVAAYLGVSKSWVHILGRANAIASRMPTTHTRLFKRASVVAYAMRPTNPRGPVPSPCSCGAGEAPWNEHMARCKVWVRGYARTKRKERADGTAKAEDKATEDEK